MTPDPAWPPLPIGATVAETLRTLRREARVLFPAAIVVFVPLGLVEAVADRFHIDVEHFETHSGTRASAAAGAYLLATLGEQFFAGVVAAAVSASRAGVRRHSALEIARTVPYLTLIAADLVVGLGTTIGLSLFLIPGIVFYTYASLTAPVIKIEGLGLGAALRRSYELVRGSFWRVLLLVSAIDVLSDALTPVAQNGTLWAVGRSFVGDWAAAVVVSLLVTPLVSVAAVVVTYALIDLRGRGG